MLAGIGCSAMEFSFGMGYGVGFPVGSFAV